MLFFLLSQEGLSCFPEQFILSAAGAGTHTPKVDCLGSGAGALSHSTHALPLLRAMVFHALAQESFILPVTCDNLLICASPR